MKPTYEQLQEQLENAKREFRSADITMQNLEAQLKQSKIDADCYKKGMEASNARLVQIAAELSAIDAIHNDAVFITDAHYEQCPPEVQKIIGALAVLQIPEYQAFLAEVRAQGVTEYASKRGFSFQHGSIHAHFGNGDVMVGSVTFENGDAGINFAPVREKTGGVGTHYDWTKGKTAEQVDSIFVIASSNAEGLEVIRDKLSEAIAQLRKGAAL